MSTDSISVCFDATRLRTRLKAVEQPTGIDRVDLAYLQALSADPQLALSLAVRGVFGIRQLKPSATQQLLEDIARCWCARPTDAQPLFLAVRDWLESPALTPCAPLARNASPRARRELGSEPDLAPARLREGEEQMRRDQKSLQKPSQPTLYINTSHGQLYRPAYARWLTRTGLRGLFFVHDLIPIEHPEYSRAAEPARHAARLDTIAAQAGAVLVNSAATRDALQAYWAARNVRMPAITVAPLGVGLHSAEPQFPAPKAVVPYFVMLGTIEPRKNHLLLLKLWRQMVAADPLAAPRLVLVGRRGWLNEPVFRLLDDSPGLAAHLIECSGLADAELLALLHGACALLNPSFAEGFGLPVAEALAAGVPVLASSLAAHREVGGESADYLDPRDVEGWLHAIRDFAEPASPRRKHALLRVARYQPPTWAGHFEIVRETLRTMHAQSTCPT
ncbi:MAG: glycosyltransferase family 1 protein [Pseudomonadota bacterium]